MSIYKSLVVAAFIIGPWFAIASGIILGHLNGVDPMFIQSYDILVVGGSTTLMVLMLALITYLINIIEKEM